MFLERLKLTDYDADTNWTSKLRIYDGHSTYSGPSASALEAGLKTIPDFCYHDVKGELTQYFRRIECPYEKPKWLSTILENEEIKPTYFLEVKTTSKPHPKTEFHMSEEQLQQVIFLHSNSHRMAADGVLELILEQAEDFQVVSPTPEKVYVIWRVSGVDIENGSTDALKWTVYLDPFNLIGERGGLEYQSHTMRPNS